MPRTIQSTTLADIAGSYRAASLSVIPIKLDGTKRPDWDRLPTAQEASCDPELPAEVRATLAAADPTSAKWTPYQYRLPTAQEVNQFFQRHTGIGICCGIGSGGVEVFDFDEDADEIFPQWLERLESDIRKKLTLVETGGGGYHVPYRCKKICGNEKLAMSQDGTATYIETRGQGGYIVGVGSPLEVHDSRQPYVQVMGAPLPELPTMTADERLAMFRAAAVFDRRTDPLECYVKNAIRKITPIDAGVDSSKPWDDFDQRADWTAILQPHGWRSEDEKHWTRPGKSHGTSAVVTQAKNGCEVLVVFSANAGPLAPKAGSHRCVGKFEAFKALQCGGNNTEAIRVVRQQGFGKGGAA